MTTEPTQTDAPVKPITSLDDPRVIQILSTEHWSLLGARSLAYNEAFIRGGMFLTFLSMSFVALALLAQGMSFGDQFLTIAAVVLAFDFVIGLRPTAASAARTSTTCARSMAWRAFATPTPRSPRSRSHTSRAPRTMTSRRCSAPMAPGRIPGSALFFYAITTSGGMIGLIVSMVGGVLAAVLGLLVGLPGELAVWIGIGGGVIVFVAILVLTLGSVPRHQEQLGVLFPAPKE